MTNTLRGSLFCFTDAIPRHLVPGRVLAAITAVDRRWILSQDNDTTGRQVPDENVVHVHASPLLELCFRHQPRSWPLSLAVTVCPSDVPIPTSLVFPGYCGTGSSDRKVNTFLTFFRVATLRGRFATSTQARLMFHPSLRNVFRFFLVTTSVTIREKLHANATVSMWA